MPGTEEDFDELPGPSNETYTSVRFPQQRVDVRPPSPVSDLTHSYEHLMPTSADTPTSQDYGSTDDETRVKIVVGSEDSSGQSFDLRSDPERSNGSAARDQLPNRPNNLGCSTAGTADCLQVTQTSMYGRVLRGHHTDPEVEPAINQPLPYPRSRRESSPVTRGYRPTPPIPRESTILDQEPAYMQPLRSEDPQALPYRGIKNIAILI